MKTTTSNAVTVLFVDDSLIDHGIIKMMMDRCKIPVKLLAFKNGKDALDYLQAPDEEKELPNIIFCDIDMPVMNGWEFLEHFSSLKMAMENRIPFYFISSILNAEEINRTKTYTHCAGYFHKPVKFSDLNALIAEINIAS